MLAIISAVGVIIGFMIVANIGLMLGKKGVVPPIIAGIGPTLCFILYGYYKVRNSQC
jgi:lipopolysaccharide export LptBFGC system permease protein LptF